MRPTCAHHMQRDGERRAGAPPTRQCSAQPTASRISPAPRLRVPSKSDSSLQCTTAAGIVTGRRRQSQSRRSNRVERQEGGTGDGSLRHAVGWTLAYWRSLWAQRTAHPALQKDRRTGLVRTECGAHSESLWDRV